MSREVEGRKIEGAKLYNDCKKSHEDRVRTIKEEYERSKQIQKDNIRDVETDLVNVNRQIDETRRQGDFDVASMRKAIAEHKSILQRCNDEVQASVDLTKQQNQQNQEQHDQNRVFSRIHSKLEKRYAKDFNGNNQLIRAVTKLEAIGYGYQKTFSGIARDGRLKRTTSAKSKSLIKRDSNGLEGFESNQKNAGVFKSPSVGNLGANRTKRKGTLRTKRKTRTASKNRITSGNNFVMPNDAERIGRGQTTKVDKLMADWEGEYYNMMGNKYRTKSKPKRVAKKKKAGSSKRL